YAARGHAFVAGVDHHADAAWAQRVFDAMGDLRGELFLHLEAAGEAVPPAGHASGADYTGRGDVGSVGAAADRRHVVFAVAFELDVAQHDHLVVAFHFLEGAAQVLGRVFVIALEPVRIGLHHALGRVEQAFALRILARP